jgi:c-di-GMP-binding flagellar brake protein YcgR
MSLEWKGKKFNSAFRGLKKTDDSSFANGTGSGSAFILLDTPVVAGKPVIPEYNAPITVRFLYDGVIYGFSTFLRMAHGRGSILVLEHPKNVEKHPLRTLERIKTIMRAEVRTTQKPEKISGVILDFSHSGAKLGIETADVYNNGDNLLITFALGDGTVINNLAVTVKNSRKIGDKVVYGISFSASPDPSIEKLNKFYEYCAA